MPGASVDLALSPSVQSCWGRKETQAAKNLSVKARQRSVSWLQGEVKTPPSLRHLPGGCATHGCHSKRSHRLVSLAHLALFHQLRNTCHVLSLPPISCDCQAIIPEESVAFPVLSLQCYCLLFFVSPPSIYEGFMHQCPEVLSQAFSTLWCVCAWVVSSMINYLEWRCLNIRHQHKEPLLKDSVHRDNFRVWNIYFNEWNFRLELVFMSSSYIIHLTFQTQACTGNPSKCVSRFSFALITWSRMCGP